jgi:putative phosphoribosyl transferase
LARVQAPTLLIVGGNDEPVIEMNRHAMSQLGSVNQLVIVPGATHLFEEPGTLEEVARLARDWFLKYLEPDAGLPEADVRHNLRSANH